jgi:galactokinase
MSPRPEHTDHILAGDPNETAAQLSAAFRDLHGHPPTAVFKAPGRVNLVGEHVDYNGGWCLPVALPHATYAAVRVRDDRRLTVTSRQRDEPFSGHLDDLDPSQLTGWAAYAAGTVWALIESGEAVPGMDLVVDGEVPVGAGLSSSAALECAVALATCSVAGIDVDDQRRMQLVEACMRAEQEAAGAPTGGMDQSVCLFAQPSHALLLDCRSWERQQVPWSLQGVDLLVVDTRARHALSDGGYAARRADCDEAARRLRRRARHVFSENLRVAAAVRAIEHNDAEQLGQLFSESHRSLRDDYEVSSPELDLVVDTAIAAGAYGSRMTGGGFGGSAIVLVERALLEQVERAVEGAFADAQHSPPGFLLARPSAGACQVSSGSSNAETSQRTSPQLRR